MNNFMQIIALQNPTFNAWAWFIGTIIMLIIAGMGYEEEPENAIILALTAWTWPAWLVLLIGFSVAYTPFWVGKKLRMWQEK